MKQNCPKILPKNQGFSLIEILIVITIIGVLMTFGSISSSTHRKKQKVDQAARTLETNLKLAKQKALSGNRPSNCSGELQGYEVQFDSATNTYDLVFICNNSVTEKSYSLSDDSTVTFASAPPPSDVTFYTLGGGCGSDLTDKTYRLEYSGFSYYCDVVVDCPTAEIRFDGCHS